MMFPAIVYMLQTVCWSAIIYTAALSGVDKNLLEAAEIDGAFSIYSPAEGCDYILTDIDATWDTYVATLKQMQLDRWVAIDQAAYERTK